MGVYTTPYEKFGQLTYSMWRACRLVVDTGIHAFGWSKEKAVDYMSKNTALSFHEINTEIVNLGAVTDFELTAEDVQESLTFDDTDMSNEDLYEIAPPPRAEANENDEIPSNPDNPGELSYKQLKEILRKGQDFYDFITNLLSIERHSKIAKGFGKIQSTCQTKEKLAKPK